MTLFTALEGDAEVGVTRDYRSRVHHELAATATALDDSGSRACAPKSFLRLLLLTFRRALYGYVLYELCVYLSRTRAGRKGK